MFETFESGKSRVLMQGGALWALAIFARLLYLQVYAHPELLALADRQHGRDVEVPVVRGTIYDRAGRPLAKSLTLASVSLNPMRVRDAESAAFMAANVLGLDADQLERRIRDAAGAKSRFMWVKRWIPLDQADRLRSMKLDFISISDEQRRRYPSGQLASHVVGSVNRGEEHSFEEHGDSGVEAALNESLEGTPALVRQTFDASGRVVGTAVRVAGVPSEDVTLSIDSAIQYSAEAELAKAAIASHAASGSVVVLKVPTGEVLAMANWPTFDPNGNAKVAGQITGRTNLAVTTPYEPGSVFKTITMAAALETTRLRPESWVNCHGGALRVGNHVVHEAHGGFGSLMMKDVFAKSSNLGSIDIGYQVGAANFYEYLKRFGIGQRTGVPILAESPGRLRSLKRWGSTSLASISIGHEVSVTAMQLAQVCMVIASGGQLIPPRLVLKRQRTGEAERIEPQAAPRQVIRPETAIAMRSMMMGVVEYGTGKGARLDGYTSGGKTGTAKIYDYATGRYTGYYNGSFIGFAPARNPQIVVVVTLNRTTGVGGFGGAVAAPVFKAVATDALRVLGVAKDVAEEVATDSPNLIEPSFAGLDPDQGDELVSSTQGLDDADRTPVQTPFLGPSTQPEGTAPSGPRAPNFRGKTMRDVIEIASEQGIAVDIVGHGTVREQTPAAGVPLSAGERIRVQLSR